MMFQFNKQKKTVLTLFIFLALFFALGSFALAQVSVDPNLGGTFGLGTQPLKSTLIRVINVLLGFLSIIAISVVLYGGFIWMTSGGSPENINKAKKILISGVIGLAIMLLSFAIVQFIDNSITGGGGGPAAGAPCDCATELGLCDPGGACLSCQNTANPVVCTWQTDNACNPACSGAPLIFTVDIFSPPDGANNVIRNKIVRVTFSANVNNITPTNFIVRNNFTGNPVSGTITVSGKRIDFEPDTPCPAPYGAWNCFDASTDFTIEALNGPAGILRLSDGTELTCDALHPCQADFTTGNIIDMANPTNVNLSVPGNVCIDSLNSITVSATDDNGIDYFDFSDSAIGNFAMDNAPVCAGGPPNVNCNGGALWSPTALAGYLVGNNYTLTVQAYDLDSNLTSRSGGITLREAHCCNGIQDPGEDGVDCGGSDCALCEGAACGLDKASTCGGPECTANDSLCASGVCGCTTDLAACSIAGYDAGVDPCCLCQDAPIIDCVTPNNTGTCVPPSAPIGTDGTLLTIWGRNFGAYVPGDSEVTINGITAPLAETINFACVNSWKNNQIIVVVPPGAGGGDITVTNASGFSDSTNDTHGSLIPNFIDDGLERPSLCLVENIEPASSCLGSDCGYLDELVRGYGIGISAGDTLEFGAGADVFAGISSNPIPNLQIESRVPNIDPGSVGFRAVSLSGEYSNYLNFRVTSSPNGPRIDYIDPTSGPEGQYVTIYGRGFGSSPAGSSVTFNGTAGDFIFPPECEVGDYWQDTHIVVKVPAGATDGNVVVAVGGDQSNGVPFDVCLIGVGTCKLLPGICAINPIKGPVLTTNVDIFGEHFGSVFGNVEFYNNQAAAGIGSWADTFIQSATVPALAKTGPVYVFDNLGNQSSNSLPFEVGTCSDNSECPAGSVCCDGACNVGSCPTPNFSSYTWSFTTGNYFVQEGCDGVNMPSPTPLASRKGGTSVCINAAVGVSFTEPVAELTVDASTVLVQECTGPVDNPCAALGAPIAGSFVPVPSVNPLEIDGFTFNPAALLNQDTWYHVTLLGGVGNITSAAGAPLIDDYTWVFKTRSSDERCEISQVDVWPNPAKIVDVNTTARFAVFPKTSSDPCLVLNSTFYSASWESTDTAVANILFNIGPLVVVAPGLSGETYIRAKVLPDNKTGQALLEVDYEGLIITKKWYECEEVCVDSLLGLRFDREVNTATLTTGAGGNVNVYECADGLTCQNYLAGLVSINDGAGDDPANNYLWDIITGESFTVFSANPAFNYDTYYRAVVKGGISGLQGVLGSPLMSLNSNLAYGEECDGGADCSGFCLKTGNVCGTSLAECEAGTLGCDVNCLHTGSVATTCGNGVVDLPRENCDYDGICADAANNAVGPPYEFCRVGGPACGIAGADHCEPVENSGCDDKCTLLGSTHTAVCGNGIIEFGEACDDNNQTNGDSCNSRCLREGNSVLGFVCGDGNRQVYPSGGGEDCDDGNNINGDGCSADCLSEGAPGSICGDGKIGLGEDCDGEKGCSPFNCLWQGSGGEAVCGNGIVEGKESESYSWVFKTRALTDDSCTASNVEVIPANTTILVDEIKPVKAVVRSNADSCDPQGQTLDPWGYDWNWWSSDPAIADLATTCGNGSIEFAEDCDDGENVNGDGCSANCLNEGTLPLSCGDGIIWIGEDCDDGDVVSGDGCSNTCLREGRPSESVTGFTCGNGILEQDAVTGAGEDCDDGALIPGDGCSVNCLNEGPQLIGPNQKVKGFSIGTASINADIPALALGNFGVFTVTDPGGAVPCISAGSSCCNTGVTSCTTQGYACMSDNSFCGADSNWTNNCFCCCDPSNDLCPAPLTCHPNISPCSSPTNSRGQCCGCQDDGDCGGMGPGLHCGLDTCCHARPVVTLVSPLTGSVDVCRNTLIKATFDQLMDPNSFKNNIEVVANYDSLGYCPEGTSRSAFFSAAGTWCAIAGQVYASVDGAGASELEFAAKEPLEPLTAYNIIINGTGADDATCGDRRIDAGEDCDDGNSINGDGCSADCLNEGTIDLCGNGKIDLGEDCDDNNTNPLDGCDSSCLAEGGMAGTTCGNGIVESDPVTEAGEECEGNVNCIGCRNIGTEQSGVKSAYGVAMGAPYNWNFTTGSVICDINKIRVDVRVGNGTLPSFDYHNVSSDIFICAQMDDGTDPNSYCKRDALRPSIDPAVPDNPNHPGNQHIFQARPVDETGSDLNFALYDWLWTDHDPQDVFDLLDNISLDGININVTSHNTDGNGYVDVEATSNNDMYGHASKRVGVKVFLCNNPWPSIEDWPWEDNSVLNPSAWCDIGIGSCNDTFFELYYCRDHGDSGPEDDLPQISSNPMVFTETGDIVKELFFIEDESGSGGPLIFNALATPCKGPFGQPFYIEARIVDMDGVAGAVASIQDPDENEIASIPLLDDGINDDGFAGNNVYGGTWNSTCPVGECYYYIDIAADDNTGNSNELENMACTN